MDIELKEINSTLKEIKKSMDNPLKIDAETPFQINLIEGEETEEKKKTRKKKLLFMIFFLLIFVGLTGVSAFYSFPRNSDELLSTSKSIICSIDYPSHIGFNDERVIELILTNKSKATSIPGLKALLIYPEEIPIIIISNKGSSIADFGTLRAGETKTKSIMFHLKRSMKKSEIKFKLMVISENGVEIDERDYRIDYIKLPFLEKALFWFFTTLVTTLGIVLVSILSGWFNPSQK
jgi:hypothetical protein